MTGRDEGAPTNRLGRIAQAMLEAAEQHPEHRDGDRAIVMLDSDGHGMLAHAGYDKDEGPEAFANLLGHVDALAQGQRPAPRLHPNGRTPGARMIAAGQALIRP